MTSFRAPACRLYTVTTGGTDKPLMLLLHGFPELWTMWKHQMNEFRDKYNVAAFDMRGYGQSDRPTVGYTTASRVYTMHNVAATCLMAPSAKLPPRKEAQTWKDNAEYLVQARREYYIDKLVEDVVAMVHKLGYKTCVLAGHDWCATRRLAHVLPRP